MFDYQDFLKYLNIANKNDTYSRIILYILTYPEKVPTMSISELADECFVSAATISRFCKQFKLNSYAHLKKEITIANKMSHFQGLRMSKKEAQQLQTNPKEYLQEYANEIKQSIDDVVAHLDYTEIDELLHKIYQAQEVILVGYSSTLELAKSMQTSLMISHKLTLVPEEEKLLNLIVQQATESTLIIVFSSFGMIFSKNADLINKITNTPAHSVLITQHTKNIFTNFFDQTIHATSNNYLQIGTYPLTFFIDFLVRRYATLYGKSIHE
jgi:DNA-binding MurR/RpiR family transcriptional regulator